MSQNSITTALFCNINRVRALRANI